MAEQACEVPPALLMNADAPLAGHAEARVLMQAIFKRPVLDEALEGLLAQLLPQPAALASHAAFAAALRQLLEAQVQANPGDSLAAQHLATVVEHEQVTAANSVIYMPIGRVNPYAVMWPELKPRGRGRHIHDELPFAVHHRLLSHATPIGAMGSCVAQEVAHRMQARGYNFVVTEANLHPERQLHNSCANWGVFHHSAGFRQFIEVAFGHRTLPKLLWEHRSKEGTHYLDPFKEEVEFDSIAQHEAAYLPHLAAAREALLTAKVFVITLELNELWFLKSDGSVLARNPWFLSPSLVDHRTLTIEENVAELQAMLDLWRQYNPELQLIVAVSPMPLLLTTQADTMHIASATAHAKAVLRVAAEQFARDNAGVYYWPAFETATYCVKTPWEADARHLTPEAFDKMMDAFDVMFLEEASAPPERPTIREVSPSMQAIIPPAKPTESLPQSLLIAGNSLAPLFKGSRLASRPEQSIGVNWVGALKAEHFLNNHPAAQKVRKLFQDEPGWKLLLIGNHDIFKLYLAERQASLGPVLDQVLEQYHQVFSELNRAGRFAWLVGLPPLYDLPVPGISPARALEIAAEFITRLSQWCEAHQIPVVNPVPRMLDESGLPRAELLKADRLHLKPEAALLYFAEMAERIGVEVLPAPDEGEAFEPTSEPESFAALVLGELDLPRAQRPVVSGEELESRLLAFINDLLRTRGQAVTLEVESDFVSTGLLDSLDLIETYTFANELLGGEIPFDVNLRELGTVRKLAAFLRAHHPEPQERVSLADFYCSLRGDFTDPQQRAAMLKAEALIATMAADRFSRMKEVVRTVSEGNLRYGVMGFWMALIAHAQGEVEGALELLDVAGHPALAFPFDGFRLDHYRQRWLQEQQSVALPDRRGFNIVLSDDDPARLRRSVEAYLMAFGEGDDVALHVLAGQETATAEAEILTVIQALGLDAEHIADVSILGLPGGPDDLPFYREDIDLFVGSAFLANRARELGRPALVDPTAETLKLSHRHFPTLDWSVMAAALDTQCPERWLVTTPDWQAALEAFLAAVTPERPAALLLPAGPEHSERMLTEIAAWLEQQGHDPETLPDLLILEQGPADVSVFRAATHWIDTGEPLARTIAQATGLQLIPLRQADGSAHLELARRSPYLITAIVSTYNSEQFMRGCLEDLVAQTIADQVEILVIDSGSPQNEGAIVREFQQRYSNIRYVRTEREPLYQAWNRAIRMATGKYLTNANTDDRHRPDAFERMVEVLENDPEIALVYSHQLITDQPNLPFHEGRVAGMLERPEYRRSIMLEGCHMGSQPMWRRSMHEQVGYFDERLKSAGDYEFWCRIAVSHNLKLVPEVLGAYYYNTNGIELSNQGLSIQEAGFTQRLYRHLLTQPIEVSYYTDRSRFKLLLPVCHREDFTALEGSVSAYLQAFTPEDPVSLLVWAEAHLNLSEVEAAILRALEARGLDATADFADIAVTQIEAGTATTAGFLEGSDGLVVLPHMPQAMRDYAQLMEMPMAETLTPEALRALVGDWDPRAIDIVLLTHNRLTYLQKTVDALYERTRHPFRLIIVDNASDRDVLDYLDQNRDRFYRVIRNSENGWTEAFTQGIALTRSDPFIVSDPDILVPQRDGCWLTEMLALMEHHPEMGMLALNLDPSNKPAKLPDVYVSDKAPHGPEITLSNVGTVMQTIRRRFFLPPYTTDWHAVEAIRARGGLVGFANHLVGYHLGWDEDLDYPEHLVKKHKHFNEHYGSNLYQLYTDNPALLGAMAGKPDQPAHTTGLTSIVMLTWNQLPYTKLCIDSLYKHTPEPFELILVDNGSTDGTVDYLSELSAQHPNVKLILNESNRGFAGGCNQGIAVSQGEYVLLLNNDTVLAPNWLKGMIEAINLEDVGAVGPRTNSIIGPQLVKEIDYDPVTLEGFEAFAQAWREQHKDECRVVMRVIGFCLLIRREVIDRLGGLDLTFGRGNFEDDDYCLRMSLLGYKFLIAEEVFIHHFGSVTFRGQKIDYSSAIEENWQLFRHKWLLSESETRSYVFSEALAIPFDPVLHTEPVFSPTVQPAELTDRRGFNIVLADDDLERLTASVLTYVQSFDETDDVALHVLAGRRVEEVQEAILAMLEEHSLDPEHIANLSLTDAPATPLELPGFLRAADLVIGSPRVLQGAQDMGLAVLCDPDIASFRAHGPRKAVGGSI